MRYLQDTFAKLKINGNYEVKYLQSDDFWNDVKILLAEVGIEIRRLIGLICGLF
ncbi:MAG: hypothetical protein ACOX1S_06935 [Anaerostipes sp.]